MIKLKLNDQIVKLKPDTNRYVGLLASVHQMKKVDLIEKIIEKSKKKIDDIDSYIYDQSKKELEEHVKGSIRIKTAKKERKKRKESAEKELP